jgi:iron complex outermembrane recepter protein
VNTSNQLATRLRLGVASAALVAALGATPTFAQTAPAKPAPAAEDESTIVVTGSILRRTNTETPSPVTVLTTNELEQRGVNTVSEALQRISANGSGTLSEGWNNGSNFATGANAPSLRGLTVQSTLTVFDGLRMAPYPLADDGHRNFVDLGVIPDAVVERLEILKDGASSTYGADAVAGVINVITKKQVEGFHANASVGISEKGDAPEQRFDATIGYGDLKEQGFNVYINGSYRRNEALYARDRAYPFNTSDLSQICDTLGNCMANGVQFGINADGTLGGGTTTVAPLVAPLNAANGRVGPYRLLNPAGCAAAGLTPVTLTAAQAGATFATSQCQQDLRKQYSTLRPQSERYGFALRGTFRVGDNAEAYVSGNYWNTHTYTQLSPGAFEGQTTAPQTLSLSPFVLPVYVCATGVGTIPLAGGANTSTGCTAANGALNPNNPFAALGQNARLRSRYDRPRTVESNTRSLRGALGIHGTFGANDEWGYQADFTVSNVKLDIIQANYLIPQRLADVAAQGTYNFVTPSLNSEAMRAYIAPTNVNTSNSDLWQAQAVLSRSLMELSGGPLQAAVGVSYRHEAIDNPSANPANLAHPFDRYYTINAVGAVGSRNVKSAFFEVNVPILDSLEVNASGRYDDYSSGQSNFSPKIGAKFTPIKQVALRGTYSKGFRIPSFNESYGLPTTGYGTQQVNCVTFAAFCAAHGNNAYATTQYSLGRTQIGNPSLSSEKSRSWTVGAVIEPTRNFSFTVDYFNIKVKNLVSGVAASVQTDALNQYFTNNGVVNIPGITVRPQLADPAFPNALALPGFIEFSFQNADSESVSGVDFGANAKFEIGDVKLSSSLDASYVLKYQVNREDGTVERYDGSLSPCDYTSCSGTPKWRGSWSNTFELGKASLTATTYYTSGYDLASVDYGGVKGDCAASIGASIVTYKGTNIPVACTAKATWNVDLSGQVKVNDKFTIYGSVLNVLGIKAPFDPSAAYSIYQYNPSWAQANVVGRYFRMGVKVDF